MDTRTLIVALVCLAAGAGLGWMLGSGPSYAPTPAEGDLDVDPAPADAPTGEPAELDSDRAVMATLRKEVDDARTTIGDLTSERDQLRQELDKLRADAEAGRLAGGTTETSAVRFGHSRFQKTLEGVDWEEAGQALSRMSPLLGELVDATLAGEPPPPSVGDIQKYNGALVKMALKAQQDGIPGSGANGSFTHVAVVANLVYSTLKQAELPLTTSQEERLGALADELIAEDEKRIAGYGDETLALQKVLDETKLKDRFYAGVDALVNDAQREALHPEALRGRCSFDLFSSGLVWSQHAVPMTFASKAALQNQLVAQVMHRYGVSAENKGVVEEVVSAWVGDLPATVLGDVADDLETKMRAYKVARVRDAAAAQVRGFERLIQRLPADAPAIQKLREEARVAVPLPTTP